MNPKTRLLSPAKNNTMKDEFKTLCNVRQSVRSYITDKPVPEDVLSYLRQCVSAAPTACNRQPFRFIEVHDPEKLAHIQSCYDRHWVATAPLFIIACRNTEEEWVRGTDGKPHGDIDTAIAIEHLCLAAAEQGLGTCWICNFDTERCKALFNLPAPWEPVALIPLGYAAKPDIKEKKRRPIDEIWSKL